MVLNYLPLPFLLLERHSIYTYYLIFKSKQEIDGIVRTLETQRGGCTGNVVESVGLGWDFRTHPETPWQAAGLSLPRGFVVFQTQTLPGLWLSGQRCLRGQKHRFPRTCLRLVLV